MKYKHVSKLSRKLSLAIIGLICCIYGSDSMIAAFQGPLLLPTHRIHNNQRMIRKSHNKLFSTPKISMEDNDTTSSTAKKSSNKASDFDKFDYLSHWYPVSWARDVPPNRPIKVTVFDVDYVIARTTSPNKEFIKDGDESEVILAMEDRCPHKSAALSEGRVSTSSSCVEDDGEEETKAMFQCAYHGWKFDGITSHCTTIPQAEKQPNNHHQNQNNNKKRREDGTAIPAMISQQMIWLFVGGNLEKALLAPPPPRVPDLDLLDQDFRIVSTVVRDFPDVDWTILLENLMDPDHGLFAHQAPSFDLYSASQSNPQTLMEESVDDGRGWNITSQVNAVDKLNQKDTTTTKNNKKKEPEETTPPRKTSITFIAPNMVYYGRRDPITHQTSFLNVFWVTPTGVGKSRFMSASIANTLPNWLHIPRWVTQMGVLNFLDQDTYLLSTQQKHVLQAEKEAVLRATKDKAGASTQSSSSKINLPVRKNLFVYRSPSERMPVRIGAFLDATLARVPNRLAFFANDNSKNDETLDLLPRPKDGPPRNVVLDRYLQHTSICPDSAGLVRNCRTIQKLAKLTSAFLLLKQVIARKVGEIATTTTVTTTNVLPRFVSSLSMLLKNIFIQPWSSRALIPVLMSCGLVWYLAKKLESEFYFKYDNSKRDRDLDKIPSVWDG